MDLYIFIHLFLGYFRRLVCCENTIVLAFREVDRCPPPQSLPLVEKGRFLVPLLQRRNDSMLLPCREGRLQGRFPCLLPVVMHISLLSPCRGVKFHVSFL